MNPLVNAVTRSKKVVDCRDKTPRRCVTAPRGMAYLVKAGRHTLLTHAAAMLLEETVSIRELRFLSTRLCEALRDALRVAESRGSRLPSPDEDDEPDDAVRVTGDDQDEPGHTRTTESADQPGSHPVPDL